MKNLKNYYKLLKFMFINNYCTDFMFQEAMMCMFTFKFSFPNSFKMLTS